VHTCINITSALLFYSSLYTSSILLGRLADLDFSRLTQDGPAERNMKNKCLNRRLAVIWKVQTKFKISKTK
jgi:hypothetical protein